MPAIELYKEKDKLIAFFITVVICAIIVFWQYIVTNKVELEQ